MKELTHLSLFTGIGGLDLAAELAGMKTAGQCEWADYPTRVLEKHWPDVPRWKDIRTLTKESFYERTGLHTIDVISGGFPCQPFSVAGKQRGKEDDRYLWPEMVRVIKELRPAWVVGENVAGIVKMALPEILSELEACGYRTRTFLIPACAVGARHRRYRVAIVGYAEHHGSSAAKVAGSIAPPGGREQEGKETAGQLTGAGGYGNGQNVGGAESLENTGSSGCGEQGDVREQQGRTESERTGKNMADTDGERQLQQKRKQQECRDRPGNCGEDVQHSNGAGCKKQYTSEIADKQGVSGKGRDAEDVCDTTGAGLQDGTSLPLGGYGAPEPEPERPDRNVSDTYNRCRTLRWDWELPTTEEAGSKRDNLRNGAKEHEPGKRRPTESLLGGVANGLSGWVDGDIDFFINHYWDTEPDIPRVAAGVRDRVGRLQALGNAVVPQQFYPVFQAIVKIEREWMGG